MRKLPRRKTSSRVTPYERYGSRVSRCSSHRLCELARRRAVLGRDDLVDDERAVEGDHRVAAARERVVVEADAVVDGPRRERQHGRERGTPPPRSASPARRRARASGKRTNATRTAFPGRARRAARRRARRARSAAHDGRAAARATSYAQSANAAANTGSLETSWNMIPYAGIDEQRDRRGDRDPRRRTSSRPPPRRRPSRRRAPPSAGSASAPPQRSRAAAPFDDRRHRRTEEHRPRRDRIGVEELRVREQVLVQVAAGLERPGDGTNREDGEPDAEENDGAERARGEPLEPCEGPGGPFLHRCHAPIA